MANKTHIPYYLILALIVCGLLLLPYLIPQSTIESKREDDSSYSLTNNKKNRPMLEQKTTEVTPREAIPNRKEENKRKLEEIEKLLE
jgi:hypothetical protein